MSTSNQITAGRRLVILADVSGESYHVGDQATLEANLLGLAALSPGTRSTVLGRPAGPRDIAATLDGAHAVLISGGGNMSSAWPDLLNQRVLVIREAESRGIPVVTGGQTIGPDLSDAHRNALGNALGSVASVGVRDLPSAQLALELGVRHERICYQVDDAFSLRRQRPPRIGLLRAVRAPYIAVTLDASFGAGAGQRSLSLVAGQLAAVATATGLRILLVPHVGQLNTVGDEDGLVARQLRQLLTGNGVRCAVAPVLRPREVIWLTQRATAVVSSRFHPIVFALAGAVPCLGLHRDRYTQIKIEGALAHLQMQCWSMGSSEADAGSLAPMLLELLRHRAQLRQAMQHAHPVIAQRETRRWHHISGHLGLIPHGDRARRPAPLGWPTPESSWAAAIETKERITPSIRGTRMTGHMTMTTGDRMIGEDQWQNFWRDGFLHLGEVITSDTVNELRCCADDLATGKLRNEHVLMQLDTGGAYEELPEAVAEFEQGTLSYRKIQGLESDDSYRRLVVHPLFMEICSRVYAPHAPISIFRAMVMNKPAGQGTVLPWHQDGGTVWQLDRDPLVTIWVALDDATIANGCMEAVRGSHRTGLVTAEGSTLSAQSAESHCPAELRVALEVKSGHALLLHNWLIHRSGVNRSSGPRRAFTGCYMDGRTISLLTGDHFPIVAGTLDESPYPYVGQLEIDRAAFAESFRTAEEYAHSLEAEVASLRERAQVAETYAQSLEAERVHARTDERPLLRRIASRVLARLS